MARTVGEGILSSLGEAAKSQLVDIIEYNSTNEKEIIWKYQRTKNEIRQGAQLIVRNGQAAAFMYRGKLADIFEPGSYTLNTGSMPILSDLKGFKYGFASPIQSDVYFVNMTQLIGNRWSVGTPISRKDKTFGYVRISARGTYSFRISDIRKFMDEIVGAKGFDVSESVSGYISSIVSESACEALGSDEIEALEMASNLSMLSEMTSKSVRIKTEKFGVDISDIVFEGVSFPEETQKLIDEQSGVGLASHNIEEFANYQKIRAMRDAAKQPGGAAGAGIGLAMGREIAGGMDFSPKKEKEEKPKDYVKRLREYKELLDIGAITQEEYDDLKQSILKAMKS